MRSQFFFFQAEDGIRDAQESRGLGDVYKRQVDTYMRMAESFLVFCLFTFGEPHEPKKNQHTTLE